MFFPFKTIVLSSQKFISFASTAQFIVAFHLGSPGDIAVNKIDKDPTLADLSVSENKPNMKQIITRMNEFMEGDIINHFGGQEMGDVSPKL